MDQVLELVVELALFRFVVHLEHRLAVESQASESLDYCLGTFGGRGYFRAQRFDFFSAVPESCFEHHCQRELQHACVVGRQLFFHFVLVSRLRSCGQRSVPARAGASDPVPFGYRLFLVRHGSARGSTRTLSVYRRGGTARHVFGVQVAPPLGCSAR